ncbi:Nitroreductase [Lentibacillus persicus]|uniref:Nitroreductase n=1 Tax=Lentibacillus persicus TaxID=640948 RepID=A0A1I1Y906_9BACI|nr:nitroreductase [Lentibacillus persicus]SFE15822.1 Nitroreductase [Lentibacillus persicus]
MESTKQQTALQQIIRDRRAVKKHYNDKPVAEETVKELLEDAVWAPTHGVRQPWRFIFIGPDQKETFAQKVAATYPEERQQNRLEYLREPSAFLIVVMEEPESKKQWDENFGATASMIQNFWLLAWEQKLGVVWKTNSHIYDANVKTILDVGENEKIVGFLHLGYFDEKPAKKERVSAAEKFTTFKG